MGGISFGDPRFSHHQSTTTCRHGAVVEEIDGLIRVYKDGRVDRFPIIREVPPTYLSEPGVIAGDVSIDQSTSLWARVYVPVRASSGAKLPVMVYFHGGGFCVGSASWVCYHEFLVKVAARVGCVVVSVNYRLAPEHRLPAAYEDGVRAVKWVRQVVRGGESGCWWANGCELSRLFVSGDSAGATIAYNVALQLPTFLAGVILLQPFFGGEKRTQSEKTLLQPPTSALSLPVSYTYWRLALPVGANRDHHYSNPSSRPLEHVRLPPFLVCIAELDMLRDREVEFCRTLRVAGKSVEMAVHEGVGHAFHVLQSSGLAKRRTQEMVQQIKVFMSSRR